MEKEKKEISHDDFIDAVNGFADQKGDDLLTDPAAVAASKAKDRSEIDLTHGKKLKAAREEKGFTVDELSEKTGIDKKTLVRVEAGEAILPLGHLIKLSKALSLRIAEVISEGTEPFTVVRASQGQPFERFGKAKLGSHGYVYESLALKKRDRRMEPFSVTLLPNSTAAPSSHDGQEFIYVLEGKVELTISDKVEILGPGDAVYYDSTTPHLLRAHGAKTARILAVLHG
jgi:quercetin dioxygenase-like cupin family protein/DNA-binding XRE family transcriptional regulator